jgi:hypothetical protein
MGRGSRLELTDVQVLFADLQSSLVAGSATTPPTVIAKSAAVLANVASVLVNDFVTPLRDQIHEEIRRFLTDNYPARWYHANRSN